ncbi:protein kinase domain-containing protein [Nocardioides hwasunensis]|uniref:non-specific serine/threonine protein kinase n=1 Tax=Nocardioides hwasunensis TaxID=397258 RepID=A0ABR8MD82_9ACTN|nr:serine/threonine-protein kinase [Nocardioides hwasunensis]MBD3913186.1 serine/threonine protein kinase [Nocardioides hwasunensis]
MTTPTHARTGTEAPPPGLTVGGYALRARLGEGGMGVVHLGQRPGERPVAIKVLRPHIVGDDEARRRLAREVSSLSRVRSRRIAEIVDADPFGEIPFVATRYVPGLSLHDHVQEEGGLSGDDLVWFADCLAEALEAVHSVGVLHRDIKPSNVIMEGRTPILIDFGLARVAEDSRITMNGWLLGTPGYLAPEILYGDDASAASDVHAWAATVAYAGTGRAPYGRGPSVAIMDRVRRGEHDLTGLDPDVLELVEDALAPDPADRPTLDEARDWLEALAGGVSVDRRSQPSASPVTLPYAAAAQQEHDAPTRLGTAEAAVAPLAPAAPLEPVVPPVDEPVHWSQDWTSPTESPIEDLYDDRGDDTYEQRPTQGWGEASTLPHRQTRVLPDGSTEYVADYGPPVRQRVPAGQRLRRGLTLLAVGGVATGGFALAPYVTLAVLLVAVWLLRSGSMAASSAGLRRDRRGVKWYDGIQVLLSAPWHAVAGLGGALLLFLWSIGIACAIALLCFAASISMTTSLGVVGATFVLATWWGPGSERVRSPVHRVVDPLARRGVPWLLVTLLVAALGTGLGGAAGAQGTSWSPSDAAPFSGVRLPGWL